MKKSYRKGVGIFLLNPDGRLWVGKRIDNKNDYWQMPQGGIDDNETEEEAMRRELNEEVGLETNYNIIGISSSYHKYDLPSDIVNFVWNGKYKGQIQRWFYCMFLGNDNQIDVRKYSKPEFSKWKWVDPDESIKLVVPFKRKLYMSVLEEFRQIDY